MRNEMNNIFLKIKTWANGHSPYQSHIYHKRVYTNMHTVEGIKHSAAARHPGSCGAGLRVRGAKRTFQKNNIHESGQTAILNRGTMHCAPTEYNNVF